MRLLTKRPAMATAKIASELPQITATAINSQRIRVAPSVADTRFQGVRRGAQAQPECERASHIAKGEFNHPNS